MSLWKGPFAALWIALACGVAAADTKLILQESYGDEATKQIVYWMGDGKAARISGNTTMISRLDEGKTYIIDHASRTYTTIESDRDRPAPSTDEATRVDTGEWKRIGSWNARKWIVRIPFDDAEFTVEVWTSDDVGFDQSVYRALIQATARYTGFEWMNVFLELDGFPVLQIGSFGPIQTRQELVSAESRPAPPGTYSLPAGYEEK